MEQPPFSDNKFRLESCFAAFHFDNILRAFHFALEQMHHQMLRIAPETPLTSHRSVEHNIGVLRLEGVSVRATDTVFTTVSGLPSRCSHAVVRRVNNCR